MGVYACETKPNIDKDPEPSVFCTVFYLFMWREICAILDKLSSYKNTFLIAQRKQTHYTHFRPFAWVLEYEITICRDNVDQTPNRKLRKCGVPLISLSLLGNHSQPCLEATLNAISAFCSIVLIEYTTAPVSFLYTLERILYYTNPSYPSQQWLGENKNDFYMKCILA